MNEEVQFCFVTDNSNGLNMSPISSIVLCTGICFNFHNLTFPSQVKSTMKGGNRGKNPNPTLIDSLHDDHWGSTKNSPQQTSLYCPFYEILSFRWNVKCGNLRLCFYCSWWYSHFILTSHLMYTLRQCSHAIIQRVTIDNIYAKHSFLE